MCDGSHERDILSISGDWLSYTHESVLQVNVDFGIEKDHDRLLGGQGTNGSLIVVELAVRQSHVSKVGFSSVGDLEYDISKRARSETVE
jgi:hypothetical protein